MAAEVRSTLFLARERPQVTKTASGAFQLSMLTMDPLQAGLREPWRLFWSGDEAKAWWDAHGNQMQAGQPLHVHATHLQAFQTGRSPEIHARVLALSLAPWRHETPNNTQHAQAA